MVIMLVFAISWKGKNISLLSKVKDSSSNGGLRLNFCFMCICFCLNYGNTENINMYGVVIVIYNHCVLSYTLIYIQWQSLCQYFDKYVKSWDRRKGVNILWGHEMNLRVKLKLTNIIWMSTRLLWDSWLHQEREILSNKPM